MKITLTSKPTNPAKLISTRRTCHFRAATSFLDQYLTTGAISNSIASTIFSPLTKLINVFTGRTFTMITLLASSTHNMITYFTLNLPALYPGTKSASKTAAKE